VVSSFRVASKHVYSSIFLRTCWEQDPLLSMPLISLQLWKTNLLFMQLSPFSRYFIPIRTKCLPQHPIFQHLQILLSVGVSDNFHAAHSLCLCTFCASVYLSTVGETSSGCGWVSWNLIQFSVGYIWVFALLLLSFCLWSPVNCFRN